jgi:long-chain acyl-CoA synthetase
MHPPSGEIRQGSIGTPIGGYRIELRGEDGEPTRGEEVGRIWIETRSQMVGYWEAPQATAEGSVRVSPRTARVP